VAGVHLHLAQAAIAASRWPVAAGHVARARALLAGAATGGGPARAAVLEAEIRYAADDIRGAVELAEGVLADPGAAAEARCHACELLGRDQAENAAAAAERGAAISLDPGATSGQIRAAITKALTSPALRRGAWRMASEIAACGGAPAAAGEVEHVMRAGASRAQPAGLVAGTGAAASAAQLGGQVRP
jgi:hypothetical protein